MNSRVDIQKLSQNELERYIDSMWSGSEQQEEERAVVTRRNKINKLKNKISRLYRDAEKLSDCSGLDNKGDDAIFKDVSESILKKTKDIWQSACVLFDSVPVSRRVAASLKSNFLMRSSDISIENSFNDSSVWHIKFPILLPRKGMSSSIPNYADSYRIPIHKALENAFPDRRPRYYDVKADIIVRHTFGPEQKNIDHDNFDYTHLLNCLSAFFLPDDSPTFCNLHICGRRGGESFSEVFILPEDLFLGVWKELAS